MCVIKRSIYQKKKKCHSPHDNMRNDTISCFNAASCHLSLLFHLYISFSLSLSLTHTYTHTHEALDEYSTVIKMENCISFSLYIFSVSPSLFLPFTQNDCPHPAPILNDYYLPIMISLSLSLSLLHFMFSPCHLLQLHHSIRMDKYHIPPTTDLVAMLYPFVLWYHIIYIEVCLQGHECVSDIEI